MGPKKGKRSVRNIEVPTDTPTEFELGDTAAAIEEGRTENRERQGGGTKTVEGEGGNHEGGNSSQQKREWLKSDQELRGVTVK